MDNGKHMFTGRESIWILRKFSWISFCLGLVLLVYFWWDVSVCVTKWFLCRETEAVVSYWRIAWPHSSQRAGNSFCHTSFGGCCIMTHPQSVPVPALGHNRGCTLSKRGGSSPHQQFGLLECQIMGFDHLFSFSLCMCRIKRQLSVVPVIFLQM